MSVTLHLVDPATPEAAACLAAYYAELDRVFPTGFDPGPEAGSPADLDSLRPPAGAFVLARDASGPIGCVALRTDGPGRGEVKRLWVAPAARGAGLAGRLMDRIEDVARSMGLATLRLDTSRHLPTAVAFYRRRGWAEIQRYNDNPFAHHWFEKPL